MITSAGLVLAATFAALGVLPILFLAQISFIVAFGVLLDTFLVRSLLVPALAYDIGRGDLVAVASSWRAPGADRAERVGGVGATPCATDRRASAPDASIGRSPGAAGA